MENTLYIPEAHRKYDVLPTCRKYNFEMIIPDGLLLHKIEKLTGRTNYMGLHPYQRYKTYEEYYKELDNLINEFPKYKQEITAYKESVIKMNNKDTWAIVEYIGESNFSFTKNKHYYVVMYKENDSWIINGVIDNEEYDAFTVWSPNCTNPINLLTDFKIIFDPSNRLQEEFKKIMQEISRIT